MTAAYDLLVFDLDGTLIDSSLDLALAVNATRARARMEPLSQPEVASYVGNGAEMLIRRSLRPEASELEVMDGLAFFQWYYREHMLDNTTLYPGVLEALESWHEAGTCMAVLTNKPVFFSRDLVRNLGIGRFFSCIYGGGSFVTKKPHPEGLEHIMRELDFAPERTLMIGDSGVDIQTARNAGTACAGVTFGLRPEDFQAHPPDILVDDMRDLAAAQRASRPVS